MSSPAAEIELNLASALSLNEQKISIAMLLLLGYLYVLVHLMP